MTTDEAVELIQGAVLDDDGTPVGSTWADLGAGSGTFTFALLRLLGPDGRVVGVDREAAAVESLRRAVERREAQGAAAVDGPLRVVPTLGDFRRLDAIPELRDVALDGLLFANALHFDADPGTTLRAAADRVVPGGRMAVVEYQDRPPNPWVPHPLPPRRLREVAAAAGLGEPRVVGERPSSYGGVLYCAWLAAD